MKTLTVVAIAVACLLGGCKPRQPMADQPKIEPLERAPAAAYAGTALLPPDGTVPWHGRYAAAADDVAVDAALLQRGRERFEIFCAPCHGHVGDGRGMIPARGFPSPPSYHTRRLRNAPDSHLLQVMREGLGNMPSYAAQVPPRDRRAIVAYIRALQLSQHFDVERLPGALPAALQAEPAS